MTLRLEAAVHTFQEAAMRSDLADVTVVMDRSASMATCRTAAETGLNEFVERQKEHPGECVFSLVQFDTHYEFVYRGVPINDVLPIALVPRGNTALLDAVGRAIIETGARLAGMPEDQRPGLVAFVILTDGHENSSREFQKDNIKEMIEHQTRVHHWQFTFLGANQDAFAEAGSLGIDPCATGIYGNTMFALTAASDFVGRMRHAVAAGTQFENGYTDAERDTMFPPAVAARAHVPQDENRPRQVSVNRRIRLRGMTGTATGKIWESATVLRVGRLAALEIVLDDDSVSSRHAELRSTDLGWRLCDLGSTNGTLLNGARVGSGQWPLRVHDLIQFGDVIVVVEALEDGGGRTEPRN